MAEYEPKQVRSREPQKCSTNLYVKNFPKKISSANGSDEFDDTDLVKLFEPFGEVQNAVIMKDADGKSKGFGFVCFKTVDEAARARAEASKTPFRGSQLYISQFETKTLDD